MTLLFVGGEDYSPLALGAIVLVCVGAIGLGVVDATEDPELRAARQAEGNRKYSKSFLALALPRLPTACSTPPAPLPTTACSKRWTRAAQTAPTS